MTDKQLIKHLEALIGSQEILIGQLQRSLKLITKTPELIRTYSAEPTTIPHVDNLPQEEEPVPHIVQEMKSVMKLSDMELLDQMFPVKQDEAS
jgi:hypothetical protein